MKLFFITVCCFLGMCTNAQSRISFSSQNYIGVLEGEQGSELQVETINGIKFPTWFLGVGTGIDWYYLRSIPVLLSVNKDFLKNGKRSFFVAAGGGVNFPWKENNYHNIWGYGQETFLTGLYWEGGLGYKVAIGKRNDALLMQAGYSYKHLAEKAEPGSIIIFNARELNSTERFDYKLRRLSLKIGWNF